MQTNLNKKEKGFTLLETMVAIFIMVLATTAPMVVAQNGLRSAYLSRDQITAFYLAQDSMEYIKNIKDDNGVEILMTGGDKSAWLSGLDNCVITGGDSVEDGCTIDTLVETIETCRNPADEGCLADDSSNDIPLKYNSNNLSYGFSGENSKFARVSSIENIVPDQEIKVTTKVRWTSHEGFGTREILVVEYMTNWIAELVDGN